MEVTEWTRRQLGGGRRAIAVAAVLALSSGIARAQNQTQPKFFQQGSEWVEEFSGFAPLSHVLKVMMAVGAIHLEGGTHEQISYTVRERCVRGTQEAARKIFDQFRVFSARKPDATVIQGDWVGGKDMSDLIADIFVQVPRSVDAVAVNAHEGNITVRAIRARLDAETSAGNIDLDQIAGAVKAQTSGGFITAGKLSSDAQLRSGAGNVEAKDVGGKATLWTAGGLASLGSARWCSVETLAGNITVQHCGGDLHAVSGGGSIDIGDVVRRCFRADRWRSHPGGKLDGPGDCGNRRRRGGIAPAGAQRAGGFRSGRDLGRIHGISRRRSAIRRYGRRRAM